MFFKKGLFFFSILSLSCLNATDVLPEVDPLDEDTIRKAGDFWEAPFSQKPAHHKDLFLVDYDVIKEAESFLEIDNLTEVERRAQQARMAHEDAKLAFNIMYYEYVTLLKANKITPPKKSSDKSDDKKTFQYFEVTKDREVFKEEGASDYFYHKASVSYKLPNPNTPDVSGPVVESDALLAQALHQQINGSGYAHSHAQPSNNENEQGGPLKTGEIIIVDDFKGNKQVEEAFKGYDKAVGNSINLNDMDVHAYNRRFQFKNLLPPLLAADKFSNPGMKAAAVVASIKSSGAYGSFTKQAVLNSSFAKLLSHLAINPVEAGETGADVQQLFSRIWSLIQGNPHLIHNFFLVMCDNLETQGGCFPGYSGRLADLYVKTTRSRLYSRRVEL